MTGPLFRQRATLSGIGIGLGILLIVCVFWPRDELYYRGRTLHRWVEAWKDREDAPPPEVRQAMLHFVSNSLPELLASMAYDSWPQRKRLDARIRSLPGVVRRSQLILPFIRQNQRLVRADDASYAFEIAGTNAVAAVPGLTALMLSTNSQEVSGRAAITLGRIGPAAIPALASVLTNRAHPYRVHAAKALAGMASAPVEATKALDFALDDPNVTVRIYATNTLERVTRSGQ